MSAKVRRVATVNSGRGLRWPSKQPAEVLDFAIDWTARLEGDAIASSAFVVPPGVTAASSSRSARETVVWLAGGVDRGSYLVVNRITTTAGREMRQAVRIRIRARSRQ
ncbi:hypothetical protein G6321_00025190 [Bradyrhizobium barranii subsp. barranii]|uniref:Uncharacterized protein n=1 Tax=Bradyrhizobium barranii subsp. barranii TaxID=2823807 RepID=A0A7Z0TV79_9BRAD|nr:hypothetical protein [Bradyrhizobium barranii]UEM17336.1 hypothetical protein J4G43_025740 [Bradyrhizobium barranii subsp. barranii]UGX98241.1 hypothetical protein G6321_00025190 [Bradyrhizobium barranii subsp. barranii]